MVHRWFTRPAPADLPPRTTTCTAGPSPPTCGRSSPATAPGAAPPPSPTLEVSPEFAQLWSEHEIAVQSGHQKCIRTAELGLLEVYCQMLFGLDQDQALLIFTATPGSDSYDKLRLPSVIGAQKLRSPS